MVVSSSPTCKQKSTLVLSSPQNSTGSQPSNTEVGAEDGVGDGKVMVGDAVIVGAGDVVGANVGHDPHSARPSTRSENSFGTQISIKRPMTLAHTKNPAPSLQTSRGSQNGSTVGAMELSLGIILTLGFEDGAEVGTAEVVGEKVPPKVGMFVTLDAVGVLVSSDAVGIFVSSADVGTLVNPACVGELLVASDSVGTFVSTSPEVGLGVSGCPPSSRVGSAETKDCDGDWLVPI